MVDSLTKTDEISDLRTRLARADNSSSRALLSLVRGNLSLPTDFFSTDNPCKIFYHFLCFTPAASDETVVLHAKTLRFLHPDKTSTSYDDPQVQEAARLVPLITSIKRVLSNPTLRRVYDQCGFYGLCWTATIHVGTVPQETLIQLAFPKDQQFTRKKWSSSICQPSLAWTQGTWRGRYNKRTSNSKTVF